MKFAKLYTNVAFAFDAGRADIDARFCRGASVFQHIYLFFGAYFACTFFGGINDVPNRGRFRRIANCSRNVGRVTGGCRARISALRNGANMKNNVAFYAGIRSQMDLSDFFRLFNFPFVFRACFDSGLGRVEFRGL